MTNSIDLTDAIARLFPNQVEIHKVENTAFCNRNPTLLHQHFYNPLRQNELQQLIIEIAFFLSNGSDEAVYTYFYRQHLESLPAEWFMATARLKKKEGNNAGELIIFSYELKTLGIISKKIYRVLDDDAFFKKNFNKVSLLTKREKEIIGLLTLGNDSNEIATKLFLSVHTVNTHRKSINNKLCLKNMSELLHFADVFELTIIPVADGQ